MRHQWTDPRASAFIAFLRGRYDHDRGALAALRGALSEARRPQAWPLLGAFTGAIGEPAFETVAALWAKPDRAERADGCFADTLRQLAEYDTQKKGFRNPSFETRFKRILTCERDEAPARVAPVVHSAHARGIAVNYGQLLSDLLHWGDGVKTEWAKVFWAAQEPDDGGGVASLLDEETP